MSLNGVGGNFSATRAARPCHSVALLETISLGAVLRGHAVKWFYERQFFLGGQEEPGGYHHAFPAMFPKCLGFNKLPIAMNLGHLADLFLSYGFRMVLACLPNVILF